MTTSTEECEQHDHDYDNPEEIASTESRTRAGVASIRIPISSSSEDKEQDDYDDDQFHRFNPTASRIRHSSFRGALNQRADRQ